jgi:hypothetical protein
LQERLREQPGNAGLAMISYQVVQEFLNVATRKFTKPMLSSRTLRRTHKRSG